MTAIKSSISPTSTAFKANAEAMAALVADLKSKMATAALGGDERSRKRHTERGKLLPRARVEQFLRDNTELRRRLHAAWTRDTERRGAHLAELARALNAVSPLDVLKRGYAILFDESGRVLRSATDVRAGERVHARLADGELALEVDAADTQP